MSKRKFQIWGPAERESQSMRGAAEQGQWCFPKETVSAVVRPWLVKSEETGVQI